MNSSRVLIVEDDDNLRRVIQIQLAREGYDAKAVASAEEALSILETSPQHLLLADLNLPGMSGVDLLKRVRNDYLDTAVIVMTAFGTVQNAVEAMKAGAYDYICKPIHPYALSALVKRSIEHRELTEEVQVLRSCLDRKYGFEKIVGSSPELLAALDVAARVAATDATVLISGETGTGKELVAKAIHMRSKRRELPFVTINCGAIPKELLESELFGHVKGSFTGAVTHKKGRAEAADRGTVLLDEIGEMPLELQVRILRLIQDHEIEKVGATTPTKVDVRIIAATHRDLSVMVKAGTFREDLFYRLLVVPITLPPLRERKGDIAELLQHLLDKARAKHERPKLSLPGHVMSAFLQYDWPGNIRQLENAIERVVVLAKGDEVATEDLPDFLRPEPSRNGNLFPKLPDSEMDLETIEKRLILQVMERFRGNQTQAAHYLNISRRALGYRLQKYRAQEGGSETLGGSGG